MKRFYLLGGGADFYAFLQEFSGVVKNIKLVIIVICYITNIT